MVESSGLLNRFSTLRKRKITNHNLLSANRLQPFSELT